MIIIIIIAFLILIRLLNYFTVLNTEKKLLSANKIANNTEEANTTYSSTTSGVTGLNIKKENLDEVQDKFDEFFKYANNLEYENAYNMLTDKCKELVYPSIESFKKNYIDSIFGEQRKTYTFENWYENIYYITIKNDALVTGQVNGGNAKAYYDYITIVDGKLNIGTYIGNTQINKQTIDQDILINVASKDTFMDYEIYNITVKNNSQKTIYLSNTQSSDNIYIRDSNNVKYGIYNHELLESRMILAPGYSRNLSLKFYSSYISSKEIKSLVFTNLIIDYESYQENVSNDYVYEYIINF